MKLFKSIRSRLSLSYLLIIMLTLIITDVALVSVLRAYFLNNVRDTLYSQLSISTDIYERYFADSTLEENVANDEDGFWRQSEGHVQIVGPDGIVLLDSTGNRPQQALSSEDILMALNGQRGTTIFSSGESGESLMAAAMPLVSNGEIVGVLRLITSLRGVQQSMSIIVMYLAIFGIAVVTVTTLISNVIAQRFIRPIDKLTKTAEIMATGNYNVVSVKMHEDEIGKLSDTLNYMANEIRKKEELKNDFISSVSHELRTPLTSIKGWAVTLKDPMTDTELLHQGLDIISNESDRLKYMVDELLDFSKFVSGKIELEKDWVDIEELFLFLKHNIDDRAKREKKNFVVEITEDMGTCFVDPNRLKQVFINLIDNSFKFTKEGGHITLRMDHRKNYIDFIVEDDGSGISETDISKVKEKFYKGKTSNSTNGIGLSICDEIALLHGGELIIESQLNEGTKVTLRLPNGGK
ncbi:sensor histidine kinase [Proteiniclasticum ruminis]|uniref:sensor histidine kinase n=1 Tax=Proteiniclasticum ruminis TaxID=398199 RepID=UPI00289BC1BE|nr:ATP-binding protein [Proteiniclasticum ruminis]